MLGNSRTPADQDTAWALSVPILIGSFALQGSGSRKAAGLLDLETGQMVLKTEKEALKPIFKL